MLSRACLWFSGFGLIAMSAIILWQVFARYVLNASPSWSEQAALYLMIWTVLFAAAAGVREEFHIRITVARDALAVRPRKAAFLAAHLVTALVGVFLAIYGTRLVIGLWGYAIPTLGLPRGSAFLPMPVAGAMIAGFALEHIYALVKDTDVDPSWP